MFGSRRSIPLPTASIIGLPVAVYSNYWYFSSGPSCDCFSSSSTSAPSSSPQSSDPSYIHGQLCPLLRKYHHMWLPFLLPRLWRHILIPMTLGWRHPHQNRLVHSRCCRHHYGGAVDHLSGGQNLLHPLACPKQCSLGSIKKLDRFPSVAAYPPYLYLRPLLLLLLL